MDTTGMFYSTTNDEHELIIEAENYIKLSLWDTQKHYFVLPLPFVIWILGILKFRPPKCNLIQAISGFYLI